MLLIPFLLRSDVFSSYVPLENHERYTRDDGPYNKNGKVFAHYRSISISRKKRHLRNPLTSSPRSKYYRPYGLRNVIERRGIAVAEYLGQHIDWVNTHGNIC